METARLALPPRKRRVVFYVAGNALPWKPHTHSRTYCRANARSVVVCRLASLTAAVMLSREVSVHLFSSYVPTPYVVSGQ